VDYTHHTETGTEPELPRNPDLDAALEDQVQHLLVAVEHELRLAPAGLSELELIRLLQQTPWQLIGEVSFSEPENLYPVHFLLFHVLYRLRDRLSETGETLDLSPMCIRLEPLPEGAEGQRSPASVDNLRAFYLDLAGYRMPASTIQRMMDDFWAGRPGSSLQPEELVAAANVLGFEEVPDSFATVKQRFRRAVMQAHPDRGGDTESVQALNQAFATLRNHFRLAS